MHFLNNVQTRKKVGYTFSYRVVYESELPFLLLRQMNFCVNINSVLSFGSQVNEVLTVDAGTSFLSRASLTICYDLTLMFLLLSTL